jgi:predicted transcriptional regulator
VRTTVDLPAEVHQRAKQLADERHQSLSAIVAELAVRGLASMGEPATLTKDPVSGLPTLTLGRRITAAEVADAMDDE